MIFLRPLFVYYYLLPVFFFIIFLTICPFFFFSPVLSSWWFLSFGPGRSGVLTDRRTNVSHLYHTLLSPFNTNNDLFIYFSFFYSSFLFYDPKYYKHSLSLSLRFFKLLPLFCASSPNVYYLYLPLIPSSVSM